VIGRVTDDGRVRVRDGAEIVADVPAEHLAEAPTYRRQGRRPAWLDAPAPVIPVDAATPSAALLRLLGYPDIADKSAVFRRYDWSVQTNTLLGPGQSDAAVLRVKGTRKAIALATDGNGRYCYLDPYEGGKIAIAEAARNVVCSGAEPLAATDCLNFGNPEKPEVYYQLEEAIRGMSDACRALATPIVSGNVSLYNESNGRAIYPTPIVGMLGLLEDAAWRTLAGFQESGDLVYLLGDDRGIGLEASAYLAQRGYVVGPVPALDLAREQAVQAACRKAIRARLIRSAHDVSDGGIAVTLAECCLLGGIGFQGDVPTADVYRWLFNEAPSRIVVGIRSEDALAFEALAASEGMPATRLGVVGGKHLALGEVVDLSVDDLRKAWALDKT